ncbi:hypothetical protein OHS58_18030 [Amycolatopsis sp. NBC_00348]|uniref:hypothetical protein n=1 Tax=Amycolatopsis sp. NBC_00348 TaxID=2975956 RepID=UPI002E26ABC2
MEAGEFAVIDQGWDGPFYRVRTSVFEVTFMVGGGERIEAVENVDAEVRLPDGSRWSATIFTLAEVERLMSEWAETGEYGGGGHLWCSDGLIVGAPGLDHMIIALAGLYQSGDFRDALNRLDEPAG